MTTGSLVNGTVQGLAGGLGAPYGEVTALLDGNPNDVVTVGVGSEIAFDAEEGTYYMGLAQNGSTWISLGSVSAI